MQTKLIKTSSFKELFVIACMKISNCLFGYRLTYTLLCDFTLCDWLLSTTFDSLNSRKLFAFFVRAQWRKMIKCDAFRVSVHDNNMDRKLSMGEGRKKMHKTEEEILVFKRCQAAMF